MLKILQTTRKELFTCAKTTFKFHHCGKFIKMWALFLLYVCNEILEQGWRHKSISWSHRNDLCSLVMTEGRKSCTMIECIIQNLYVISHIDKCNTERFSYSGMIRSIPWVMTVLYDYVIKWKHFPRYWPFVRRIHRSPVNSPNKCQWRGTLMFSLIYAWLKGWVNNGEAGDLRRHRAHYDVIVMSGVKCILGYNIYRPVQPYITIKYTANKLMLYISHVAN